MKKNWEILVAIITTLFEIGMIAFGFSICLKENSMGSYLTAAFGTGLICWSWLFIMKELFKSWRQKLHQTQTPFTANATKTIR